MRSPGTDSNGHNPAGRPDRILIIDDDPSIAAGMCEFLGELGYDAHSHGSAITAPFQAAAIDPDLILLDLSMPALSGSTFLRSGGRRAMRTRAQILLFSARDRRELARLAEELGADGFVSKQDDLDDIVRHIELVLMQARTAYPGLQSGGNDDTPSPSSGAASAFN